MDQKRSLNYPAQFAVLLALLGFFIVVTGIVFYLGTSLLHVTVADLSKPEYASEARLLNAIATFFSFFLPAFILSAIVSRRPFGELGFNTVFSAKQVATVFGFALAAILFGGALGVLNEKIPLPKDLYAKAKALEETYKNATLAMARMRNFPDYLAALLTVAVAPAVFEEVLFRGAFQRVFVGWTHRKWAGILITSLLFSAIHFSYFGFLPRLALGIVLGLIYFYSRNLWLSILLHFLNNALVVTQLYVMSMQGKPIEKTMDESLPVWWGVIGLGALVLLFRSFRKESVRVILRRETQTHSSPENIIS